MKRLETMPSTNPLRRRRRKGQNGNEIIEFTLYAMFMIPAFLWMFVNSMNLIRMIEANEVTRDLGDQYIHGVDYTTYQAQNVAVKLSSGFGLQVGSAFTGNEPTNDANGGNAWIVAAEIMYIGSGSCSSLPSGTSCTNQNQYVFLQWIDYGSKTLQMNGTQVTSALGNFAGTVNTNGLVANYMTDPNAVCSSCGSYFQTPFADGQVAYASETFFASPDLNFTAYPAGGIHSLDWF
jgi:hypothetical protein